MTVLQTLTEINARLAPTEKLQRMTMAGIVGWLTKAYKRGASVHVNLIREAKIIG